MCKTAVHFGAGSIGRGFLGQLYYESGYHTVFIDVVDDVVNTLNSRGAYPIDIVSDNSVKRIHVRNVSAANAKDADKAAQALAGAAIASTAVGMHALPHIAPIIARGIETRFAEPDAPPLDIILCENIIDGERHMRALVKEHLPPAFHEYAEQRVGFVEASIGRMVPVMTPAQKSDDPLLVRVEPYCELPVDAAGFKGAVPAIVHLKPTENFAAYVERKLFLHNMTHAATAYLGHLRGHTYICDAVRDSSILPIVEQAGNESCDALSARHGLDRRALDAHRQDLISRYHNRGLADQIMRVARDPMRKLGSDDRFVGAARLCVAQQIMPAAIAVATAAAMLYHMPDDPGAHQLQTLLEQDGPEAVLRNVCGLNPGTAPGVFIVEAYHRLRNAQGKQ